MSARKIAIVGFARPHRDLAPYDDPSWEIWGVNDAWSFMPRSDRWFEIHSLAVHEWELRRAKGHIEFLASYDGPLYMIDHYDQYPNSIAFPLAEVLEGLGRVYLTSSIAYMLALAIHENPEEIGMWGVDMRSQTEYAKQRPACEWLIGVAEGRGIKVTLPEGCALMQGELYGRGDLKPDGEKITHDQMQQRLRDLTERTEYWTGRVSDAKRRLDIAEGAHAEARYQISQMVGIPEAVNKMRDRADALEQKKFEVAEEFEAAIEALQKTRGSKEELTYWIGTTPEGADPRVLGGLATLAAPASPTSQDAASGSPSIRFGEPAYTASVTAYFEGDLKYKSVNLNNVDGGDNPARREAMLSAAPTGDGL